MMMTTRNLNSTVFVVVALILILVAAGSSRARSDGSTCDYCELKLPDRYVEYKGKKYHKQCYSDHVAARCAKCGKKLTGQYVLFNNEQYHESCYLESAAIRCGYCSRVIEGTYLTDFWGNAYHKYHQDQVDKCEYCGRLISNKLTHGGRSYGDGRHICGICRPNALDDVGRVRRLLDEVAQFLKLEGIEVDPYAIDLLLASRDDLASMTNRPHHDLMGFTRYEYRQAGVIRTNERFKIYLLAGVPRSHLVVAAAHELMHVWQFQNAKTEENDVLCEGSSNYAAYLILSRYDGEDYDYLRTSMVNNTDIIYGAGFRRVRRLVEDIGVRGWLQSLVNNSQFPSGF